MSENTAPKGLAGLEAIEHMAESALRSLKECVTGSGHTAAIFAASAATLFSGQVSAAVGTVGMRADTFAEMMNRPSAPAITAIVIVAFGAAGYAGWKDKQNRIKACETVREQPSLGGPSLGGGLLNSAAKTQEPTLDEVADTVHPTPTRRKFTA